MISDDWRNVAWQTQPTYTELEEYQVEAIKKWVDDGGFEDLFANIATQVEPGPDLGPVLAEMINGDIEE